jgi:ferredoxin-thioredoxin reductase catalytic subunit
MIKMMISFGKDYFKYKEEIKKQSKWIDKYISKKNYEVNPSPMMSTNLKIWLCEMELIYGKRICPCFDPSGDKKLDQAMTCPCKYMDQEIEEYGTCHCALFGKPNMSKSEWKESNQRLMSEYRVPLNLKGNVLDTRNMPMDKLRNLPTPDASHQLKNALMQFKGKKLIMIVATEQETLNLEKIAKYKNYSYKTYQKDDAYYVELGVRK